jgi:NAD(P)-dependent dehydrogenase (short-subunit alcohol dehydrogenase family)
MTDGLLEGRVAIVTGAGRGLGHAEAVALAQEGAHVVVNDLAVEVAEAAAAEIRAAGGSASAYAGDVADWATGKGLIESTLSAHGRLDVLVNNAGNLRDRAAFNLTEDDWDSVIRVHLKGHFVASRFAVAHWRERYRSTGALVNAKIVNTASDSGLFGYATQLNYAAAKAGIAAMTLVLARECERFGVRVNALAPVALTAMTGKLIDHGLVTAEEAESLTPENVAAMACWLASDLSEGVTGQVLRVRGGMAQLVRGWRPLPPIRTASPPWTVRELAARREELFADAAPGLPPSWGPGE